MSERPLCLLSLRAACEEVVLHLNGVSLSEEGMERTVAALLKMPPACPRWDHPAFPAEPGPLLDAVVVLGNALNFSYWTDEPLWTFSIAGEDVADAFGLFGLLSQALREGLDLGDARILQGPEIPTLLARGRGHLPMIQARVAVLATIGQVLAERFEGRLEVALAGAPQDALGFAQFLVDVFPPFVDERTLAGVGLAFGKRAQLAAGMLHAARLARGLPGLTSPEALTLYADYMLPRSLRALGVLVYQPALAALVDGQNMLEVGGALETSLRVATVLAGERLVAACREKGLPLTALELDYFLWRAGFEQASSPFHRVRCIDY